MLTFEIWHKNHHGLWNPTTRIITIGDYVGPFSDVLEVTSNITGDTLEFKYDEELAMKNEFWDGEMLVYRGPYNLTLKLCRFDL